MSSKRYPEEFRIEAVKKITEKRYPISEVASRLGVSQHGLYKWLKIYGLPESDRIETQSQQAELRLLKAELKRVTEERDILKKATVCCAQESRRGKPLSRSMIPSMPAQTTPCHGSQYCSGYDA